MKDLLQKQNRYYLLIILACCSFSATAIGISTNCMGLFIQPIAEQLSLPNGSITLYITIMSLCSAFFAPVLSTLIKKIDIRYILSIGILLNALILFIFSFLHNIYLFYLFAILLGIGNCCFSLIPITLLITNWFNKLHGFVSGLCLSFSGVAGALFNPIINLLIINIGWREAYMICALMIIVLALPFAMFIVRLHPQQVGLTPYGSETYFVKTTSTKVLSTSSSCNTLFIVVTIYAIIISFTVGFNANIASFASSIPLSSSLGATMVSAAMIANILSKIVLGYICDQYNAKIANFIMIFISICGCVGIMMINQNAHIFALLSAFLYGFIFAANAAGIPLLIKEVVGNERYTKTYSIITVFTSTSYAIGVSIIGFSYDIFQSYQPILITLILLCILNLGILIFLSRHKKGSYLN